MSQSNIVTAILILSIILTVIIGFLAAFNHYGPTFEYEQPEWMTVERDGVILEEITFTARFQNFFPSQWRGSKNIDAGIQAGDILTIDLDAAYAGKPAHEHHREGEDLYRFDIGDGLFPGDTISGNTIFLKLHEYPYPATGTLRVVVNWVDDQDTEARAQRDADGVTWFWLRQYYYVSHVK